VRVAPPHERRAAVVLATDPEGARCPMSDVKVRRALVSVTDKTGIAEFCAALSDEFGVEIVSTGGTAKTLAAAGVPVRPIADLTGFPEMMDGRVKTLHPKVHGGLLARRGVPAHMAAAEEHGIGMIDMVVVNLYAFEATVAKDGVTPEEAVENIDIGGPSMLRSAAKNFESVTVVTDPASYGPLLAEMRSNGGATTLATRRAFATEVFRTTSAYDNAIYSWMVRARRGRGRPSPRRSASSSRSFRTCATARTRTRRLPSTATPTPSRTRSRMPSSCTARSCRTTTSSTPTRPGRRCASSTRPGA
jgi:AICAR transformylase/IMP cyclohydrolase PurH